MSDSSIADSIATASLLFDPSNPRFPARISSDSDDVILERMIRDERVVEVMHSIGVQGYFSGEPLLVTTEGAPSGKYYVVEGNRRLAALKLLNGELLSEKRTVSTSLVIDEAKHKPDIVPCLIFNKRKDILRYLGFKHITGIKSWGPLAKARYLKQLREDLYANEPEDMQLKMLAKEIGSRAAYVGTMLTGLKLYEMAEEESFFHLSGVNERNIEFTLLTTAISYSNISDYVGLSGRADTKCEEVDLQRLKEIFSWIYARDQQGNTIVADSRQLKNLAAVVANDSAVEQLKKTGDLNSAYLTSEGPQMAFSKLIKESQRKLSQAYETLPSVKELEDQHLEEIQSIIKLSRMMKSIVMERLDDD